MDYEVWNPETDAKIPANFSSKDLAGKVSCKQALLERVEDGRLGRTEARVSDISLGSGAGTGGRQGPEVAREAIERGINYFDTAPDYSEAGSEDRLGRAI